MAVLFLLNKWIGLIHVHRTVSEICTAARSDPSSEVRFLLMIHVYTSYLLYFSILHLTVIMYSNNAKYIHSYYYMNIDHSILWKNYLQSNIFLKEFYYFHFWKSMCLMKLKSSFAMLTNAIIVCFLFGNFCFIIKNIISHFGIKAKKKENPQ